MRNQRDTLFKQARMEITGNIIQCGNHTIQMTNISRMWTGKRREEELPINGIFLILLVNMAGIYFGSAFLEALIMLGSMAVLAWNSAIWWKEGLHIKLCSGEVCSFLSDNQYFVDQVYSLMNEIMIKKDHKAHYGIIFSGNGTVMDYLAISQKKADEEEKPEEKEKEVKKLINEEKQQVSYGLNDQLFSELQILHTAYGRKEDGDPQILSLIEQTENQARSKDLVQIKNSYRKFIELGLINECNDLGLNVLIGEIKKHIFG